MRHDAARSRQDAKSEMIRHSLGMLTPQERKDQEAAEERRRLAEARKAAQGQALFEEQ